MSETFITFETLFVMVWGDVLSFQPAKDRRKRVRGDPMAAQAPPLPNRVCVHRCPWRVRKICPHARVHDWPSPHTIPNRGSLGLAKSEGISFYDAFSEIFSRVCCFWVRAIWSKMGVSGPKIGHFLNGCFVWENRGVDRVNSLSPCCNPYAPHVYE